MKKVILFGFVFSVLFSLKLHAQSRVIRLRRENMRIVRAPKISERHRKEMGTPVLPVQGLPLKKWGFTTPSTTGFITVIPMGSSGNAFGAYGNNRTYLWAEPALNSVSFSHRMTLPSSGYLSYDLSKDAGQNWNVNLGPVYKTVGPPPNDHPLARYPQGAIFNPAGNTIADSAYFTYFAPLRDTTNPGPMDVDWGGIAFGAYQLSGLRTATQHHKISSGGIKHVIPDAYHITQTGKLFSVEPSYDDAINDYTDSMILATGAFYQALHDLKYTFKNIYVPLSTYGTGGKKVMGDSKIAFAPDGLTGYFSVLGHNDWNFKPDSAFYPILYKTTDGGSTWNGPINVPIDGMGLLAKGLIYTDVSGDTIKSFCTGFEHDLAVDVFGMPHIFVLVCPSLNNWSIPAETGYMTDLYQDASGNWTANVVSTIQTYKGGFGANSGTNQLLYEWNRGQISTTYDGTKVFYTWFDSDTTNGNSGNITPDMLSAGMNVVNNTYLQPVNFTLGTPADASVTFACVSYYVFEPSPGSYEIPVAYQNLNNNQTDKSVDFYYIKGAVLTDAGFATRVNEPQKNKSFFVSQNNPNPFHRQTNFTLNLSKDALVHLSIYNIAGEKLSEKNEGNLHAGQHQISFEGSDLAPGIYFYSIKADEELVNGKMIVE